LWVWHPAGGSGVARHRSGVSQQRGITSLDFLKIDVDGKDFRDSPLVFDQALTDLEFWCLH